MNQPSTWRENQQGSPPVSHPKMRRCDEECERADGMGALNPRRKRTLHALLAFCFRTRSPALNQATLYYRPGMVPAGGAASGATGVGGVTPAAGGGRREGAGVASIGGNCGSVVTAGFTFVGTKRLRLGEYISL
jgi:hypothetical protein